jgi:hypothetical protein
MVKLHDLKFNQEYQPLTWNNMRKTNSLFPSQSQPRSATPHTAAVKSFDCVCRVNGRHKVVSVMQGNTRARISDVGGETDDAADVKGTALHGVPVCRETSEYFEGGGDALLSSSPMFACECSLMLWASA